MSAMPHILIVEDKAEISRLLADHLQPEGYEVSVLAEGSAALDFVREHSPDCIILDLMLSGVDGRPLCGEVRRLSDAPVLLLTANVDEIDRLPALELGVYDYVCKPYSTREVAARVKNILRRVLAPPTASRPERPDTKQLSYRNVMLEPEQFQCKVRGQTVKLTPVEFRMLQAMMSFPGHVFSREQLMDVSYTDDRIVSNRTIDTHVKNLRKKLVRAISGGQLLHSIYGIGYKFE